MSASTQIGVDCTVKDANSSWTTSRKLPPTQLLDSFDYFVLFYTPAVWLIGTFTNILLIVVFTGTGERTVRRVRNPNIVMFITIAIADILVVTVGLLSQLFRLWAKWVSRVEQKQIHTMREDLHPVYVAFATMSFLLEPACSEFSIWSECFLSCARFAAICWPHKLRTWLHFRGTVITIIVLACVAFFLRVPLYIAHFVATQNELAKKLEATDPFLLLFLRFLIPVVILVVTTHGILLGLRKSTEQFGRFKRTRQSTAGTHETVKLVNQSEVVTSDQPSQPQPNSELKLSRDKLRKVRKCAVSSQEDSCNATGQVSLVRVTFVLIGKNVSYFVFVSTYIIVDLLKNFALISINATTRYVYTYAYMLALLHHITSFFICLAGGRRFRQESLRALRQCFTGFKKKSPSNSSVIYSYAKPSVARSVLLTNPSQSDLMI